MNTTLVCRSDGASRGNPGPAGAGVVVFGPDGRERRAISVFLGETTNNVAEYRALIEALAAATEVCGEDGVDTAGISVVIKTDSQLAARQIAGEYRVKNAGLIPLLGAFRKAAQAFRRVEVVHVPREEGPDADRLANEAIDKALGKSPKPAAGANPAAGASPYSCLHHLECSRCGEILDPAGLHGSCPSCDGPLLARYDLSALRWPPAGATRAGPRPEDNSMWRYHQLLPVVASQYVVSLGEGLSPLVPLSGVEGQLGLGRVFVKDEGLNPTGTFKARGASAAVSRLVELGAGACAVPTAGNAGAAFAAYAARAGMRYLTAMPSDTPESVRLECESYGGEVRTVPGLLPDAARYVKDRARTEPWFVASTFDEPYRVEGKKTLAFELFEAFGSRWPDAIVFPVGGGVALVAAWKAALELAEGGAASGVGLFAARPPRLFAVQATGCSPVVRAFAEGLEETSPFPNAQTLAWGLRVPGPKAGFLCLKALRETGGGAVAVDDESILAVAERLRRHEGLNVAPEGAAAVAALPLIARSGGFDGCREVVVVNTGSGLKYAPAPGR